MKVTPIIWQYVCISCHVCVSCLVMPMSCLCVTFTSWLTPSLECYYRNGLIGTHMCIHPVSEWPVFFTLQWDLFTSCNVSNNASLVSSGAGGGGVNQIWTGLDRGRGDPKNSQICADILYGWPLNNKSRLSMLLTSAVIWKQRVLHGNETIQDHFTKPLLSFTRFMKRSYL